MNPSEETERLAKDASKPVSFTGHMLPIISESIGKVINDFEKYLNDTAPEVSNNKEDKDNGIIHKDA